MKYLEIIKLIITAFIPILGWGFGWWVANQNFKKQRYDKVKENILLEIRKLKEISIAHYTKRDNSAVYIIQSFKELTNVLIEEKFIVDNSIAFNEAWKNFRIASTSLSDNNLVYKNDSDEVAQILIAYNVLHQEILRHKFIRKA